MKKRLAVGLTMLLIAAMASAITMFPKDVTCPVCHEKGQAWLLASYGSYACDPEGALQLVACPITYSSSLWTCRKCRLTLHESDIETGIGEEFLPKIRAYLESLPEGMLHFESAEASSPRSTVERFEAAEGVYRILGRQADFWSEFYRVAGYFAEREGKTARATELRQASLRAAEQLLDDPSRSALRKYDQLAAGAMAAKLGLRETARSHLRAVRSARYDPPDHAREELAESGADMNALAKEILNTLD